MHKNKFFNATSVPTKTDYLASLNFNNLLTKEMAEFSYDRMEKHRKLVLENIKTLLEQINLKETLALSEKQFNDFKIELMERGKQHDLSKFFEPEKTAYVYICWKHHSEKTLKQDYPYPDEIKPKISLAIQHHFQNNSHHSDFYCYKEDNIREKNKEKVKELLKNMHDLDLLEMVADWMAISQEYQTSCIEYAIKTIGDNHSKPFCEEQKTKIFKWISLFEPTHQAKDNLELQEKNPIRLTK